MRKAITALIFLGALGILIIGLLAVSIDVPNIGNFEERRIAQSTKIYDRTGEILLYDIHGEEKRTIVPWEEIPRHVKNATIAIEDDNFYRHRGFRPLAFLRAVITNLIRGNFEQGGSTITQQLVKNTLLTPERTIFRKIKEIIIAIKIERLYSKDEILNLYLNQIPYGSNAYGIEAAAETFFGKHARDLTLLEAAYLASLPNAPSYYSPYGKHAEELDGRAQFTLNQTMRLGFITQAEYDLAKSQQIKFAPASAYGIIAPHFVIEVREELNKRFGEEAVEKSGFKVITTLDADLQQKAEETIAKFAEANEKNFNATNASMVAQDPKTGDVLVMVGSRNYFDTEHEGNFNVATARRQPGSAFKPFVYATALKNGYTPDTTVFDLPTEFNPLCSPDGKPTWVLESSPKFAEESEKCYHPKNFDEKFRGPVTFREALSQSLNVPSVKVLYLAGLENALNTAKDFGITSLNEPDRYGLTLVLGGGEVSLLELTSAFAVFAADGIKNDYRMILKVEDAAGKTTYEPLTGPRSVIDANIARAINDMLSDNKARSPAFGEFSALYFPGKQVAAKTGTTNDFRDAWVLGYTPNIAVGAWAGNNNNAPMEKKVAGFIVAPMWHEFMDYALSRLPNSSFTPPEPFPAEKPFLRGEWRGGREFVVDKISGKLATAYTPPDLQEKRVVREVHSILYWIDQTSPQFKNWEEPVRKWAASGGYPDQDGGVIPKERDDVHIPGNFPKINRVDISPHKDAYKTGDVIVIKPDVIAKFGVSQIDFFTGVDEKFLGSIKKKPFEMSVGLEQINGAGQTSIKIKVYDTVGNQTETAFTLTIAE